MTLVTDDVFRQADHDIFVLLTLIECRMPIGYILFNELICYIHAMRDRISSSLYLSIWSPFLNMRTALSVLMRQFS
jgi:hypothetical protein